MAAFTKTDFIWMNGALMPWNEANVHVTAHALHYGTGVFEGMRSYGTESGPAIFRLHAHMRRFAVSAEAYEIELPFNFEQLSAASLDVIRVNRLTDAYLRPVAFYDSHSFAVWPKECPISVAIIAVPGKPYIAGAAEFGVRASISSVQRIDVATLPPWVKANGHYTNSVRAAQDAMRRGYDDAILLNKQGEVAEGSGANLFMVKNGTIITNDLDASILLGVTRDSVLQIARDLGLPVEVRAMTRHDVETADELFFSGTAVEVMPIKELDGRVLGDGKPGPVTRRIQQTFQDAVHGKLPQYEAWLSRVNVTANA